MVKTKKEINKKIDKRGKKLDTLTVEIDCLVHVIDSLRESAYQMYKITEHCTDTDLLEDAKVRQKRIEKDLNKMRDRLKAKKEEFDKCKAEIRDLQNKKKKKH